ncbi:MAG: hypothetical protein IJ419_12730, partial [Agathobacter sp.]|nr:hypothetical protein [Agathobacter sp.]
KFSYAFEQIMKADFAGQEAVKKLQELLHNEEQYILQIAAAMANERFQEMIKREETSKEREQQTKELKQQAQEELAKATEIKNNMSKEAQKIALEAVQEIPEELRNEHNYVMEYLRQTNPMAHYYVQMALAQRNQTVTQEVEERVETYNQSNKDEHERGE